MEKIKFNIILLLATGILLLAGNVSAQDRIMVRGNVTDSKDNGPIPGVSVAEVDKDNRVITGTTTDMNGNYAVKIINPNDKLMFSFIGYKSTVEDISGRNVINVPLELNSVELTAVVVQAQSSVSNGMLDVNDRDMTASVSKISTKDLEGIQATSIDEALQGRLAGVDIVATSGDPGAGMAIRIRGTSSLTASSDPLIVIDNMPSDISVSSDFDFGSADEQSYSQLLNIPPGDIQEITVLKDAAATAVWGSRASNGVLMITTKRGKQGPPQVNFSLKGSATRQPKAMPTLSGPEYTTLIQEAYSNSFNVPLNTSSIREFSNDPNDPYYYYNYGQNTNWVDAITQLGYIYDANLSVGGGGEKARYRASVDYNNQQGTTVGTDFRRLSARVNLDYIVSKKIRFQTDLSYTYLNNDRNYGNSKDNQDNVRSIAYSKMPNMSIYEYDVTGARTSNYFSPVSNIQGTYNATTTNSTYNPVAMVNLGKNKIIGATVVPTFNLIYDIVPSVLKFTTNIGFTVSNTKNNQFLPQDATGVLPTNVYANLATDVDQDVFTTTTITKLLYSPHLGEKHSLIALLMFQTDDKRATGNSAVTTNTASSLLEDPSVNSLTTTSLSSEASGVTENRHMATLANAQYGLLDRYIINGSIRMDGSSKFGPNRRYAFFPSISGRWRISGEPFMKNLTFLNDFSLKASYGSSGNEPLGNFNYISSYNTSAYTYLGYNAISPSNIELSNYRWETVFQSDLGVTLQLFKNRLNIDGDWYRKRTKDMILDNLAISSVTGFSNMDMNAATMDNEGWEVAVDATFVRAKNFTVRMNFNMAKNNNMIREISPFFSTESGNTQTNGSYYVKVEKNTPFGTFYGYKFKGVYKDVDATIARDKEGNKIYDPLGNPIYMKFYSNSVAYQFQPGDAMYEDINHDGSIDASDVVSLGNSNPTFSGGFGPTIVYKNLSLVAFFTYRYGNDLINRARMNMENMSSYNNQSTAVLKRWHQPGDVTNMPRALLSKGYNWLASSRFVEDGSFIRFKQLTLSYKIKDGLKKFGVNNMSAYLTVQNLYTWTKYTGQDPEVVVKSTSTNRWAIGYDDSMTPPVRTVTVGLDFAF